jgi:hypothetical protein
MNMSSFHRQKNYATGPAITINVPVVCLYGAVRDVMILMGENPYRGSTPSNGPSYGLLWICPYQNH